MGGKKSGFWLGPARFQFGLAFADKVGSYGSGQPAGDTFVRRFASKLAPYRGLSGLVMMIVRSSPWSCSRTTR